MARRPTSEDERRRRREQILDAAMVVCERQGGIEALSFRVLAVELGLSYSAPYRYFASKRELVNALRVRAYRWVEASMRQATVGRSNAEARLEALAEAYIRCGLEHPDRYALMFFERDDTGEGERSLDLRAAKRDALDVCTQVIAAGQSEGVFPTAVDPLTASHLFWIGAHGLVSLQVAGQFVMGRDLRILVPALIRALRTGMERFDDATAQQRRSG